MGYSLYYDDHLQFIHFIPSQRLTESYYKKLKEGHDQAMKTLSCYWSLVDITYDLPNWRWVSGLKTLMILCYFMLKGSEVQHHIKRKLQVLWYPVSIDAKMKEVIGNSMVFLNHVYR
jgi:hypothetical protein